jgi:cytochrome c oxidase cbb3-type subunit III
MCHGVGGEGGRGPKLANSARILQMNDEQVFKTIRSGISGTGMLAFPVTQRQGWELVAFIRSLNTLLIDQDLKGNPASGQALFFGRAGCSSCHMIMGRGGLQGPDLSGIAAQRSAAQIAESIRQPSAFVEPGYRGVRLNTVDGRMIEGLIKNDSTYSIQVLDLQGNLQFFSKDELRTITYNEDSLMPASTISDEELQDLLVFLSRQAPEGVSEQSAKTNQAKKMP